MGDTCPRVKAGNFTPYHLPINKVVCAGCDRGALDAVRKSGDFCRDQPGSFECRYNASCQKGEFAEHLSHVTYSCGCNPCDHCSDEVARAEGCADCLTRTCSLEGGTDTARAVCSGCTAAAARAK